MSRHATILRESASGDTPAILDDLLSPNALFDAESAWSHTRIQILRQLTAAGIEPVQWPQSIHWNWAYKAATLSRRRLEDGALRLFGIEAAGSWQGILVAMCEGYVTRRQPVNQGLVYVDYVESAPWNWDIPLIRQTGKYRGVGVQLMEVAIRWSVSLGFGGRIGLHGLPQAERFYADRCGMINLGSDAGYHDLCYFELTEQAAKRLVRRLP